MVEQTKVIPQIPPFVFGTSGLGNIYKAETYQNKKKVISASLAAIDGVAFFDTAGKYGAGLALEVLGSCLAELNVESSKVIISNKLGWYRTELTGPESTFEPGIWKDLKYDAQQRISYQGILDCFEQGNELLGDYNSDFVSVHDPDEYLLEAESPADYEKRYNDILDAYSALTELKLSGKVKAIGVGAKDWKVIEKISNDVALDWIMIANSLTLLTHPIELIEFISKMEQNNIPVINSAIFNGGFLIGSDFYNYRPVNEDDDEDKKLITWRNRFYALCNQYALSPAVACYHYANSFSGIKSIAMSTTNPDKVAGNIAMADQQIPFEFWAEMYDSRLIKVLRQRI